MTDAHERPRVARRRLLWPAALLWVGGCAAAPEPPQSAPALESIANRLVEAAETRVDLRYVRACVYEVRDLDAEGGRSSTLPIAEDLEHQLVVALHSRIALIDRELAKPGSAESAPVAGATHLLIGGYARDGDELAVRLRMVAADSNVIVAAVEGHIPLGELSEATRAESNISIWRRPSDVWRGR